MLDTVPISWDVLRNLFNHAREPLWYWSHTAVLVSKWVKSHVLRLIFLANWANCVLCYSTPMTKTIIHPKEKQKGFISESHKCIYKYNIYKCYIFLDLFIFIQLSKVSPWVWWRSVQTDKLVTFASFEGRWSATATQVFRRESHLKRHMSPECLQRNATKNFWDLWLTWDFSKCTP